MTKIANHTTKATPLEISKAKARLVLLNGTRRFLSGEMRKIERKMDIIAHEVVRNRERIIATEQYLEKHKWDNKCAQ